MTSAAETKTKNRRSNFYYSFLLLPSEKRRAIITLYEFCRRTDDIVDSNDSIEKKSVALREWKEQLIHSLDGSPTNPSLVELSSVVQRFKIPQELFLELVDGVAMDLAKQRYQTFRELYPYCYRVGSTVGLMSIEIFGYRNPEAKNYAINLGVALQLTNILRDLKSDVRNGRIYLPQEDLRKYGYAESELQSLRVNKSFENLIRFECQRARNFFRVARSYLKREDSHSLYPAETMAAIYERLLRHIERRPGDIYRREIRLNLVSRFGVALGTWIGHSLRFVDAR